MNKKNNQLLHTNICNLFDIEVCESIPKDKVVLAQDNTNNMVILNLNQED